VEPNFDNYFALLFLKVDVEPNFDNYFAVLFLKVDVEPNFDNYFALLFLKVDVEPNFDNYFALLFLKVDLLYFVITFSKNIILIYDQHRVRLKRRIAKIIKKVCSGAYN
jgi:hypothetical protein